MKTTIRQAVAQFERSSEFSQLKPNTQSFYTYGSEPILEDLGARRVDSLRRVDILTLRDVQSTPAISNRALSTVKRLLSWCLDREMVETNVALSVRAMPLKGRHRPWTPEGLQVMRDHSFGLVRKLFLLSLYSAQRRGDCLRARWGDVQGDRWRVQQEKTGHGMSIPLTQTLIDALERGGREDKLIRDSLYPNPSLGQVTYLWGQTRDALGLEGYTLHGLRVTRATQLAQAGCSPHEIAALTGHKTLKMVESYTQEVSQERMVNQALNRLSNRPEHEA